MALCLLSIKQALSNHKLTNASFLQHEIMAYKLAFKWIKIGILDHVHINFLLEYHDLNKCSMIRELSRKSHQRFSKHRKSLSKRKDSKQLQLIVGPALGFGNNSYGLILNPKDFSFSVFFSTFLGLPGEIPVFFKANYHNY